MPKRSKVVDGSGRTEAYGRVRYGLRTWFRTPPRRHLRFLALCSLEPMNERQAKAVGVLAGKAGHDDIVDVTVVEGAIRRHDAIVTSSHTHIRKIADAARAKITIEST